MNLLELRYALKQNFKADFIVGKQQHVDGCRTSAATEDDYYEKIILCNCLVGDFYRNVIYKINNVMKAQNVDLHSEWDKLLNAFSITFVSQLMENIADEECRLKVEKLFLDLIEKEIETMRE